MPHHKKPPSRRARPAAPAARPAGPRPGKPDSRESKVYGLNAALAVFARRRSDIIKLYLTDKRKYDLSELVKWCASERRAYKLVDQEEMAKISGSMHNEGVCLLVRDTPRASLESVFEEIDARPASPACLVLLDGVENPHNVGALLRVCAHFSVRALFDLSEQAGRLAAATVRVSEGAAEHVPVIALEDLGKLAKLARARGFQLIGTSPAAKQELFTHPLPARCVFMIGSEAVGLPAKTRRAADFELSIPGSGAVESLNVSCAAAVVLAEYYRQHFTA